MKLVDIKPSPNKKKKYRALFCLCKEKPSCCDKQKKLVDFGAKGYEDYTTHGDEERKERYLARHEANENWDDPFSAGALSRWILWNKKSLTDSISDYRKRFNL